MAEPELITIINEPYPGDRFYYVGADRDGNQFMAFVTGAFPGNTFPKTNADWRDLKRWYAVLHRFDQAGNHIQTESLCAGTSAEDDSAVAERAFSKLDAMLGALRSPRLQPIRVKLFRHSNGEYVFGLFYEQDPDEPAEGWVMLQPNDVMFHEPWNGEYSS